MCIRQEVVKSFQNYITALIPQVAFSLKYVNKKVLPKPPIFPFLSFVLKNLTSVKAQEELVSTVNLNRIYIFDWYMFLAGGAVKYCALVFCGLRVI